VSGAIVKSELVARAEARVEQLLVAAEASIRTGDLASAARLADAALRRAPDSPQILRILGEILLLTGEPEQARAHLEEARRLGVDPDGEALIVLSLLASERLDEAAERLAAALASFAVEPNDRLALAASRLVLHPNSQVAGWLGLAGDLKPWGEVKGRGAAGGLIRFHGALEMAAIGAPLLGAPGAFPADFNFDGRGRVKGDEIHGWASLGWAPKLSPDLIVADRHGHEIRIANTRQDEQLRHKFAVELRRSGLRGPELTLLVQLPDGRRQAFPDSPLLRRIPPPPSPPTADANRGGASRRTSRRTDVIIPVYEGLDDTLACIASVRKTVGPQVEIVVVNDASPNEALVRALNALAAEGAITLLNNEENLGFPASVNRGFTLHPARDVVVLNADVEVYPRWFEGLRAAAYAEARIGTVTPLANSASIASYPADGADCNQKEAELIARHAARVNGGLVVDAPSGVGYCMYIRRSCLTQTGMFDAACFNKGYGEEHDFCLRANRLGWRSVIAPQVYVRHVGGVSFGARREALFDRSQEILGRRYPGYVKDVDEFWARDPLSPARRGLDEALLKQDVSRVVLMITSDMPGGVDRFVKERAAFRRSEKYDVILMRPASDGLAVRLEIPGETRFRDLVYDQGCDARRLADFLKDLPIEAIEFHHFIDIGPEIIDQVRKLGLPYDVYIHDYIWVCPRITLMDGREWYCGEPEVEACEACLDTHGGRLEAGLSVSSLRSRSAHWLSGARRVIAPAHDVADRLRRYFPGLAIEVRHWEPAAPSGPPRALRDAGPAKVAVIGAIGDHKGYQVLLACAKDAAERALPLEFVLIGFSQDDEALWATGKVFVTGEFEEAEIEGLVATEAPDACLFASVWPETWCYSLTHALRADLPVAAFDLGAIAERLRQDPRPHVLMPLNTSASQINDRLLSMCGLPGVARHLQEPAPSQPVYFGLSMSEPGDRAMEQSRSGLIVSGEVLPLEKGIYRFSVDSAAPTRIGDEGALSLPAVHVGPGPSVAPEDIEIMPGLGHGGAWLYEPQDLMVVKIKASSALMVVTSIRSEGMAPLEISVERMDVRAPPEARRPQAAPAPEAVVATGAHWKADDASPVRTRILAHVQRRGDLTFDDHQPWAGVPGEDLPIEAFSIVPLEGITAEQIEFKALTATGVETPWSLGGMLCGTRGMAVPLVGFAVRLTGEASELYDCEYRGAFRSGKIVGPISNGAPCRALAADDYLEGIQLKFVERAKAIPAPAQKSAKPAAKPAKSETEGGAIGPRFSVFRERAQ
jgi:GT2 family glycosyltransferase/glycosyltransferase involved in cell wall biosynthesis